MSFLLDPPLLYASGRVSPSRAVDAARRRLFDKLAVAAFATCPVWL